MTAREQEQRKRRRLRREARERAYREHVVGGPLVEIGRPVMSPVPVESAPEHARTVSLELESRARRVAFESALLAYDFARRCCVVLDERDRMREQWCMWQDAYGMAGSVPTHSTSKETRTLTGRTIPRIPTRR